MKQLLRIAITYSGIYDDKDVKEVIISSQKELDEAIEENTRDHKPWSELKFGEEGWTTALLFRRWSSWDDSTEVRFRLLNIDTAIAKSEKQKANIDTAIAKLEKQKANIDHEIEKYKLLIET